MRLYLMPSLALVLCSACTSAPTVDRANPYQLNEAAAREVQAGRLGAAEILLERAVLIAPHDAAIRRNRDALRDYRAGSLPSTNDVPSEAAAGPKQHIGEGAEPGMALWPSKN